MEKKNKILAALALGSLLILLISSLAQCRYSFQSEEQETPTEASDATITAQENNEEYQQEVNDALDFLKSSIWVSEKGDSSIEFKDNCYIESDGNSIQITAFEVLESTEDTSQTSLILSIEREDGTNKDSLVIIKGDSPVAEIASDDFQLSQAYSQTDVETSVSIEEVNDELRELLGGSSENLKAAISNYVSIHLPYAQNITWSQVILIDYANQTVSTSFTCDDPSLTTLAIEYSLDDQAYEVVG